VIGPHERHDWEARFAAGDWAYLGSLGEAPSFALIVFNESLQYQAAPLDAVDRYSAMLNPSGLTIVSIFLNPLENSNVTSGANGLRWRVTALERNHY
jgi:hypothetical protein